MIQTVMLLILQVNEVLDCYDMTPLHYAAWCGKTDAVNVLIAAGDSSRLSITYNEPELPIIHN